MEPGLPCRPSRGRTLGVRLFPWSRTGGRERVPLASLARIRVLVIDDVGLGKLGAKNRRDPLEVIEDRDSLWSTIVASQLPVEVTW